MRRAAIVLLACAASVARAADPAPASAVVVDSLRCEHLVDPIGIHEARPRLSWVLHAPGRGQRQTAYRIQVATTREALAAGRADRWDSGDVASDASVLVPYGGAALPSRARAWWRVRVHDRDGAESPWSEPASWEMGLIAPDDWSAAWIEAPPAAGDAAPLDGATWIWYAPPGGTATGDQPKGERCFRRAFEVDGARALVAATLRIAVDDRFAAWLDGEPLIGLGDTGDWRRVHELDLAPRLAKPGRHVLAVVGVNAGGPAGVAAKLALTYGDGTSTAIVTDRAWRAAPQHVDGWETPAFDDAAWAAAGECARVGDRPWGALGARANPVPYLRRRVTLPAAPASARLYVAALGLHRATIDGKAVGDTAFAGEWTDYRIRVRYQAYDVTALLGPGEHVLGVALGDGWYCGHVGLAGAKIYGERPALRWQLELTGADGARTTVVSDGEWRCAASPMRQSDLLDGEIYDARAELAGWDRAGFDDRAWIPARVREEKPIALDPQVSPPVRRTQEVPAIAVTQPKPGAWTFDLGQNIVGFARLRATAPAGTHLVLRFAEMLNPDGTVYTANMRGARATDDYVCKGGGEEVWEPSFTFHGFRYVEVAGLPTQPAAGAITGVVIGSDTRRIGEWTCSDERLNRLYANIVWGQRGNYLSVPTDCPQRDERCGWMGDAQVFARTAAYDMDVAPFFAKWLVDVDDAQTAEGSYPDIAPRVACGDGTPAWADAGVICPWTVYRMSGDVALLARHYAAMAKYIAYVRDRQCDGLIRVRRGSDYGDWLAIGADTDKEVIGTAYFAYSTSLVARAAEVLGKADDAASYRKLFADIAAAFRAKYLRPDGRIHNDTQCVYLMALRFGLIDGDEAAKATRFLVEDIRRRDVRLSTGFVGVSYLLPVLGARGESDLAWALLEQDAFPSWLFSVKQGATTIWERWDGWTPDRGFQDAGMNSFNHYSLGSCGEWMFAGAAGIDLDARQPGFKRIALTPHPGGHVTRVAATHESPYGRIAAAWTRDGAATTYEFAVPVNATAELTLPVADGATVREGDAPAERADGVKALTRGDGVARYELQAGEYRFVVR